MTFIAEIILVQLSFVKYVEYQPYKMLKMSMMIIPAKHILDLCNYISDLETLTARDETS